MKILFTGASSFTGHWFVKDLADAGHDVVAVFRRQPGGYDGIRRQRVEAVSGLCRPVFGCTFGDNTFLERIAAEDRWDLLCHHAANVTNYKSPEFDPVAALANNTHNLPAVLHGLRQRHCGAVLLTGSVFEPGEGAGSDDLPAVSPYGLSKGLTAEVFRHYALSDDMTLGKFVIPNPFGPLEEMRFTTYLARSWYEGCAPEVRTPQYVRDNIHVTLLAKAYVRFAEGLADAHGFVKANPSCYAETMGDFTARFAAEMRPRLSLPCEFALVEQTDFSEPIIRVNTDALDPRALDWNEGRAWDNLAAYYRSAFSEKTPADAPR